MVETQCNVRPVRMFLMSDLFKKLDQDIANDFVKIVIAIFGFYLGVFYLEYVDTEYSLWLTWFLTPVIVTFLLPAVLIVLIYISSIIFYLYRLYRLRIVDGVQSDWKAAARVAVCALWDAHGWLWHGYEVRGLENVPEGPFLVIYYHGALPIDMYYFIARMMLFTRRHIHTVADKLLFKIPGWASLLEGLCVTPGTVTTCASVLRGGNPLAISPGGVYEAQFGDHYYNLKWKSRIGFAKVAKEANVPIVPMFTQNVREAFRTVGWLRGVWLRIYAATRIPLAPVYGGFPVKLITHLGKPIYPAEGDTPEILQQKVSSAIENLIEQHQRVPGNILLALLERVYEMPKKRKSGPKSETNGKCHNGVVKNDTSIRNDAVVKNDTTDTNKRTGKDDTTVRNDDAVKNDTTDMNKTTGKTDSTDKNDIPTVRNDATVRNDVSVKNDETARSNAAVKNDVTLRNGAAVKNDPTVRCDASVKTDNALSDNSQTGKHKVS